MTGYELVEQMREMLDREGTGDLPALVVVNGNRYRPKGEIGPAERTFIKGQPYATFNFESIRHQTSTHA